MKKILFLSLFLFASCPQSFGAWAYVQSQGTNGVGGTTLDLTTLSSITAGNCLVGFASTNNSGNTVTIADNNGGDNNAGNGVAWPNDLTMSDATDGVTIQVAHACNHNGGATTVTGTTNANILTDIVIFEISGLASTNALDQVQSTIAVGGANMSSGATPGTLAANNEFVFGIGDDEGGSGVLSAGSGFANLTTSGHTYFAGETMDSGSATTATATFTSSVGAGGKNTGVAVYKLASAAAAAPREFMLLGVGK